MSLLALPELPRQNPEQVRLRALTRLWEDTASRAIAARDASVEADAESEAAGELLVDATARVEAARTALAALR